MTTKGIAGTIVAYLYNNLFTHLPFRRLRRRYLSCWFAEMGTECGIQMGTKISNGRKVHLGNRVVLNWGCVLDGRKYDIHIGDDVSVGPETLILTLGHDPQSAQFSDHGGSVTVGRRAWIGQRSILLPNVEIGEGAVIGAGSVVTKNVEPFSIVAGNPAKKIGTRNQELEYQLNYSPWLM
jgi:maltose O-acetyltransferase